MRALLKSSVAGAFVALSATAAGAAGTDWPVSGHDAGGQRYSPLTQINKSNVANLQVAWTYHMTPAGYTGRPRLVESVPVVIGNSMYISSSYGEVIALNATTGAELWKYKLPDNDTPTERGVAYWKGAKGFPAAIVFGSRMGRLYQVNAKTGTLIENFGEHGIVNLKTPEVMGNTPDYPYGQPAVPVIYKDLIVTGAGTPDAAPNVGAKGDTRAWDAKTGKLVWTFHTTPRPGEYGYDTWGGDSARNRSGVNVWGYFTIDAKRGILYMPLGAPNNDRVGVDRPGNNLFSSSVVAVDANTGRYLWHFQVTHHDIWDNDTQDPPVLMDVHKDGKTIPALLTVNKNALAFILDRVTGKPIYGVEERPVPKSNVPGEETSPTQPFPLVPEPLAQNTLSRDNLYKDTPEHKAWCEQYVDSNNMLLGEVPYTPTALNRYTVGLPGTQGGVNYYGGAYDPRLGLFVVNISNLAQPMRIVRNPDGSYSNSGPLAGTVRFWDPSNHLPCTPTPWGQLVAVDVNTGKIAWRSTLGVTDSLPEGKQHTGRPGLGGAIVTASGLTFVGATDDARFRAFDTKSGKELWTVKLPASAESTPITYADAKGQQYIAVVATGGFGVGAALASDSGVVFSLY